MLVLTRKETEKILFPTLGVTVELLRIRGNKARIGIEAPTEIPVVRQELSGLKSVEFTSEVLPAVQLSRLLRRPPTFGSGLAVAESAASPFGAQR